MKRALSDQDSGINMKKMKSDSEEGVSQVTGFANLDDNLLFEVFKHVDATTLATAAGVSKQWFKTAHDERLWELICTRHWANIGCGNQQLRSVVLALGGFRRLHSLYPWHLSKPQPSSSPASSSSSSAPLAPVIGSAPPNRWGKDELAFFPTGKRGTKPVFAQMVLYQIDHRFVSNHGVLKYQVGKEKVNGSP